MPGLESTGFIFLQVGLSIISLFWFACSVFTKFREIDELKSILYKNTYPCDLVAKRIKEFLGKILTPKPVLITVLKKGLVILLYCY